MLKIYANISGSHLHRTLLPRAYSCDTPFKKSVIKMDNKEWSDSEILTIINGLESHKNVDSIADDLGSSKHSIDNIKNKIQEIINQRSHSILRPWSLGETIILQEYADKKESLDSIRSKLSGRPYKEIEEQVQKLVGSARLSPEVNKDAVAISENPEVKKRSRKKMEEKWTEEEIETLRKYVEQGLTAQDIYQCQYFPNRSQDSIRIRICILSRSKKFIGIESSETKKEEPETVIKNVDDHKSPTSKKEKKDDFEKQFILRIEKMQALFDEKIRILEQKVNSSKRWTSSDQKEICSTIGKTLDKIQRKYQYLSRQEIKEIAIAALQEDQFWS